jgi:hypothetical protein
MRSNIQGNNFTELVSHQNIGSIKFMIRHVRNIRSIRNMVNVVEALLPLLVRVAFGKLDELLAI